MEIFYITTESKGKNVGPQNKSNNHGPFYLACLIHTGQPPKKQKSSVGQGDFQSTMFYFFWRGWSNITFGAEGQNINSCHEIKKCWLLPLAPRSHWGRWTKKWQQYGDLREFNLLANFIFDRTAQHYRRGRGGNES